MNFQVKEENGKLFCYKHEEKKEIIMFIMDNEVPFNDALICSQCIQEKPTITKQIIGITQVCKMINEKCQNQQTRLESEKQIFLEGLQKLLNNTIEYQNKVTQQTDMIIKIIVQWITDAKVQINLIQELQQFHYNNFKLKQQDQFMQNIHKAHLSKLITQFKQLAVSIDLQSCHQQIKVMENIIQTQEIKLKVEEVQIKNNEEQPQIIKADQNSSQQVPKLITQVNSVKQSENCSAIAFNKNGTLMVAGFEHQIKVWQFNKGKLIELQKLIGHTDWIYCLVFSKNINWFASGGIDKTIRGWKEQGNQWVSTQPLNQHSNYINCLILNNQENELISCSYDKTIKVCNVDCQSNQIYYNYTLENKHTSAVYSISLNLSETALVSCSSDETIILWKKGQQQKWVYANHIKVSYGFRICFISGTQIFFQPYSINQNQIFQIESRKLVGLKNLTINLNEAKDDQLLFPTIYNKKRQMIIQKHNKYVYIIQKQIDRSFKIVLEPIDCQTMYNYGSLTQDGEYLVIYNDKTKEFKVYQISY